MPSEPNQAQAFFEYLKKSENKQKRHLLQKAFDDAVVAAGALAGFHFSADDLKIGLEDTDVVGGGWSV